MAERRVSFKLGVDDTEGRAGLRRFAAEIDRVGRGTEVRGPVSEGFRRGLREGGDLLEGFGGRLGQVASLATNRLALIATGAGIVATGLAAATRAAAAFDSEFTKSRVFLRSADTDLVRSGIRAIDPALGTSTEKLQVFRKALLDTADPRASLEMTRLALAFGKVTDSAPTQAVETTGSLLDSLGLKADSAERVLDLLFTTMKRGGGEMAELGPAIGRVTDVLSDLGGPGGIGLLEQVSVALIRLGEVRGGAARRSLLALEQTATAVLANRQKLLEEGIDLDALVKGEGELLGTLRALEQFAQRGTLEEIVPRRAIPAVRALVREIDAMKASLEAPKTDSVLTAEQERAQSLGVQIDRLKNEYQSFLELIGQPVSAGAAMALEGLNLLIDDAKRGYAVLQTFITGGLSSGDLRERIAGRPTRAEYQKMILARRGLAEDAVRELENVGVEPPGAPTGPSETTAQRDRRLAADAAIRESKRQLRDFVLESGRLEIEQATEIGSRRIALGLSVAEAQRAIADETARFEGRAVESIEPLLARRRAAIIAERDLRLEAIAQVDAIERKRLAERLDGIKAEREALLSVLPGAPAARETALKADPDKRLRLARLTDDLAKAEGEGRRLDAQTRAQRAALGDTTTERLIADTRRAAEARIQEALEERNLARSVATEIFQIRRTLGEATLADEIRRLDTLIAQERAGSLARVQLERQRADAVRRIRDEEENAAIRVINEVKGRLKEKGVATPTLQDIRTEAGLLQGERNRTLEIAAAGGGVDPDKLVDAIASKGLIRALAGIGTADILKNAVAPVEKEFLKVRDSGAEVTRSFGGLRSASDDAAASLRRLAGSGSSGGAGGVSGSGADSRQRDDEDPSSEEIQEALDRDARRAHLARQGLPFTPELDRSLARDEVVLLGKAGAAAERDARIAHLGRQGLPTPEGAREVDRLIQDAREQRRLGGLPGAMSPDATEAALRPQLFGGPASERILQERAGIDARGVLGDFTGSIADAMQGVDFAAIGKGAGADFRSGFASELSGLGAGISRRVRDDLRNELYRDSGRQ